jgi:hypothetical protein
MPEKRTDPINRIAGLLAAILPESVLDAATQHIYEDHIKRFDGLVDIVREASEKRNRTDEYEESSLWARTAQFLAEGTDKPLTSDKPVPGRDVNELASLLTVALIRLARADERASR